jgi:general secretion pathway protein L
MTITSVLDIQLARLKLRYAKTPLPRFFAWWLGELMALLPARWRAVFAERAEELLVEARARELGVWRQSGDQCADYGRIALDAPAQEQQNEFTRLRDQIDDPNLRVIYCIAPQRSLRRELNLPSAAEDKLRQVLAFEMDRQTPFKADQVYFDYRVAKRDAAAKNLQVELTVVPRIQLDSELAALAACGVTLDGVDCWQGSSGGGRAGLNLLPPERRVKRKNLRLRLNLALATVVLVLLVIAMLQSVSNREAALTAMTADVEKAQNDAKQVTALKKTLQDTIASANFLNRKKIGTPLMTEMLNDLSHRLPDDTYLERLSVDDKGKVEIQGLSSNASRLVEDLQKSDVLLKAGFVGTIQSDARLKKERFTLVAQLPVKVEVDSKDHKPPKDQAARTIGDRKGGTDASVAGSP